MRQTIVILLLFLPLNAPALAQNRMVLIDQDGSGPGGSNQHGHDGPAAIAAS